jgi:creatinine amidohydrolase
MDVERYLENDDRVILITGATEQHGYISLLTDIEIPVRLATAVAQRTHVLVAPPLNFGVSFFFMQYPGTVTLQPETFAAVLVDVINSLYRHGFRRMLILNGHGGNQYPVVLDELQTQNEGLRILWHNWWNSQRMQQFAADHGLSLGHANWSENFPFCRVAEVPSGRKVAVELKYKAANADTRAILGDGSTGDYYQIDDMLMQELFDLAVAEITALVEGL